MGKRLVVIALSLFAALTSTGMATMSLAAGVPARLAGVYTASFTGSEVSSKGPHGLKIPAGRWTLTLAGTAARFVNTPAGVDYSNGIGPAGAAANRIAFAADVHCPDQKRPITKGIYSFTLTGKTLRFTKVSDSCNTRATDLTAHPWTKQK